MNTDGIFSSFLDFAEAVGGVCLSVLSKLLHILLALTVRPVLFVLNCIVSLVIRFGKYLS